MSELATLVEKRINVLRLKQKSLYEKSRRTKEQYEELGEHIAEAKKSKASKSDIAALEKRRGERAKQNAKAVEEFNRVTDRLEENEEILATLRGDTDDAP